MKRMIIAAIALAMLSVSIGGCWPWWYEDGRGHDGGTGVMKSIAGMRDGDKRGMGRRRPILSGT